LIQSLSLFSSPAKRTAVVSLVLVAATLLLYAPASHNGFVNFDDDAYILRNPHVRAGVTWPTIVWSFTHFEQANWHPLTWISHALDCQLFGLNPSGHHLTNVLLHALNVVLLFLVLQGATGSTSRSFAVAALFAFHPANVESVAWIAERKNVLSMFFFLLALLAYVRYAKHRGIATYMAVFVMFLLALMSKPQVITFPCLIMLWDYWPLGRIAKFSPARMDVKQFSVAKLTAEKIPLLVLAAASAVVTVMAQRAGYAMLSASDYGLLNRAETALTSYVRYLGMLVWPSRLAVFYPHREGLFPVWQVIAASFLLVLLTAIAFVQSRKRPYLLVGWLWFLGAMFPMIGIVQVGGQALADRYAYIPFIALFAALVWLVGDWAAGKPDRNKIAAFAAAIVLIAFGVITRRQIGYWHDSESLWTRALDVTQDNFVAHTNLATVLEQQGRIDEAMPHVKAALAIRPDDVPASLSLATYEQQHGEFTDAMRRYEIVLQRSPDPEMRFTAYSNLGAAYRELGEYEKAKLCYQGALGAVPGRASAMVGLGIVAEHLGDFAEATRQFSAVANIEPNDVIYLLLADALNHSGREEDAQIAIRNAEKISPDIAAARTQVAKLLSDQ
jgi:protein O-mannosyl-transferase